MKLHELPMGGRFAYKGANLVKSGPPTASDERGNRRMIPRPAEVRSCDQLAPAPSPVALAIIAEAYTGLRIGVEQLIDGLADALGNARRQALKADLARLESGFLTKTGIKGVTDLPCPKSD